MIGLVTDPITDSPDETDGVPSTRATPRRRIEKAEILLMIALAIGLALVVRGLLVSSTGDARSKLPTTIERINPVPDAVQALSQTDVFADLAVGYTGVFVIDGVEIETVDIDDLRTVTVERGQQIDLPPVTIYEPGNATMTFTPSAGAPITSFDSGLHRVELVYWRVEDGRARARSYSWTFNVV